MQRFILILIMLCLCACDSRAADIPGNAISEPFGLGLKRDAFIVLGGIAFHEAGKHILSEISPPDPNSLNRHDINTLDRFAADYYSKRLSDYSDLSRNAAFLLFGLTLLPDLSPFSGESSRRLLTDTVMFLEAEMLISGLTECAKGLSERPRPYAYNPEISLEKRGRSGSFESFWSGHTSAAFTVAVFTGYVFQRRHPGSKYVRPLRIAGLSCATATAVLRIRSGNHFPTDVAAAAAAGSFIGWLVPRLHERPDYPIALSSSPPGTTGLGFEYRF